MTSEIESVRKELEKEKEEYVRLVEEDIKNGNSFKVDILQENYFNVSNLNRSLDRLWGLELAQKKFVNDMVFMLSKYFQSTSRQGFIQMKGNLSYQEFCKECYDYLKSLGVKDES